MSETEVRDRAAPVGDIPAGRPLQIAIHLGATTADWLVAQALLRGTTPMAIAKGLVDTAAPPLPTEGPTLVNYS